MMGFNQFCLLKRLGAWLLAASAILAMAGCGGGGGNVASNGVGVGGTGVALGPVTGFGSIIVNGIRFDDSSAAVQDDDGLQGTVKLGMMVTVDSGQVSGIDASGLSIATASKVVFASEIKGPVQVAPTLGGNTLQVLGQTVTVDASTVYDNLPNGLASIALNDLLEVYGYPGTTAGAFVATRIERKATLVTYKLAGVVNNLSPGAKTFSLGGASVSYAALGSVTPQNGDRVRVTLSKVAVVGVWSATKLSSTALNLTEGGQVEVEGVVTDFVSLANFKVNGQLVDASGSGGTVSNGQRVEVEGVARQGVLVASKVSLKNSGGGDVETRLFGPVESADPSGSTVVVRGVTVSYDGNTRLDGIAASGLVVGANLEVRGYLQSPGTTVLATRIKLAN
jgi:hypothetical protein